MGDFQHWNTKERILELLFRLVKVPSVTGTRGELRMGEEIISIMEEIPYFQMHPNQLFSQKIKGDSLGRKAVAGLYKGNGQEKKTIVLLSHYDVVGVEDFGRLTPLAFSPSEYTSAMAEEELPVDIEEELKTGEWIFGRGTMDMKAGLALQLALLSEITERRDLPHNILLLSTPDEERYSMGMFAGVELLQAIREEFDLDYELTICSEPSFSAYPGDRTKYFYTGSVGKVLPLIYCMGKETHVGEPLEGVNAAWMAGVYANQAELSTKFLEHAFGEHNPLPTALKLMDLKESYNVQTPTGAYVMLNILTLQQNPEMIIDKLREIGSESSFQITERMKAAYKELGYSSEHKPMSIMETKTYTYQELYERGVREFGDSFVQELNRKMEILRQDPGMNMGKLTAQIAETIASYFKSLAPFYLIMFAPPYYPHVYLGDDRKDRNAMRIVEECVAIAKDRYDETVSVKSFFPGLSDVSYCRLRDKDKVTTILEKEMPLYGNGYDLPLTIIGELEIPAINLGPYGKDAHKRTERLEVPFSTEVLPVVLKHAVYSC